MIMYDEVTIEPELGVRLRLAGRVLEECACLVV